MRTLHETVWEGRVQLQASRHGKKGRSGLTHSRKANGPSCPFDDDGWWLSDKNHKQVAERGGRFGIGTLLVNCVFQGSWSIRENPKSLWRSV